MTCKRIFDYDGLRDWMPSRRVYPGRIEESQPMDLRVKMTRLCSYSVAVLIGLALQFLPVVPANPARADQTAPAESVFEEDFEGESAKRWVERDFPSVARRNQFSVAESAEGNHYLRVDSLRSSSGRGVHLALSVDRCPHLSWRWRVSNTIELADISLRERDDAAAKIYLVFDGPSIWNPLDKRILVYVWDNRGPVGRITPNAWLPESERMWVLEDAASPVNEWVHERVDLAQDFRRAFPGEDPGELEALAFIADTDNAGGHVSAGLDDLTIRCRADETHRR